MAPAGVNPKTGNVTSAQGSANSPANSPAFLTDAQTVYNDLNSGNYTGAWNTALSTSSMFGTNMGATTTDPLLGALESSQGLQTFDPTKKWNQSSLDAYYAAFNSTGAYHGNNTGSNGYLGKNPYGDWGSASAITSGKDQAANIAQEGMTPDVSRFVGAKPTTSFLSKYGGDVVSVVGDVVGAFYGDPMAGNQIMALADAAQGNWTGALTNAASSFVPGLGAAAGSALDIGTTAGTALVGAGFGAAEAGLGGGNPLIGALGGAASGAISGSGIKAGVGQAVGGGTLGNVAGSVAQGGLNMGAGMAVGALGSAISGSPTAAKAPIASPTATTTPSQITGASVPNALPGATATPLTAKSNPFALLTPSTTASTSTNNSSTGANSFLGGGAAIGLGAGVLGGLATGGAQGNNGNMAQSTDTSLAGTFAGAIPGVLQATAGGVSSMASANAQSNAEQNAITTQQNTLGNINGIWGTQQQLGQGAQTALGSALGTNGQPANYSGFENMPGYQFAVQQGTQAIQRQAAAMGSAYTPNTAAAVGQYVTGTASQDYNTYISQLMGAAGLGSTANTQLQGANINAGNNISTLQQNIGQAQAAGYSGVGSAVGGLFGQNGALSGVLGGGNSGGGGGVSGPNGSGVNGSGANSVSNDPYATDQAVGNGTGATTYTGYDASGNPGTYDFNGNLVSGGASNYGSTGDFAGGLNYGSADTSIFSDSGDDATSFLGI
jgi:hypothetical protein